MAGHENARRNEHALFIPILIVGMVFTGACNTILLKLQLETKAKGIDGVPPHYFGHPWVQSLNMFLGEILCLAIFFILRAQNRAFFEAQRAENHNIQRTMQDPVVGDETPIKKPLLLAEDGTPYTFNPWVVVIPAACDMVGTTLSGIGLLYIKASVWQMLRGSIIVFTGILSRIFLNRTLMYFHYFGMSIVVGGLVLVGCAGVAADDSGSSNAAVGVILILAGMIANAIQFVVEEKFLTHRNYPPLLVVGWEGIWGTLICGLIALPITYYIPATFNEDDGSGAGGRYENVIDAFYQFGNNGVIIAYGICAMFSIAFYNFFGLSVSQNVSSLARAVLDSLRTILIWAFFVILYYAGSDMGEKLTKWSIMQVAGFVCVVIGSMIYGGTLRVPGFQYPEAPAAQYKRVEEDTTA